MNQIRTRAGTTIELPPAGVLCVVGGNNVGKSQLLRDVSECIRGYSDRAVILESVEYSLDVPDDVEAWARSTSIVQAPLGQTETFMPPGGGQGWQLSQLQIWLSDPHGQNMGRVMEWFLRTLDAAQRVGVATGGMGQPGMEITGNPIHALFIDGDLARVVANLLKNV